MQRSFSQTRRVVAGDCSGYFTAVPDSLLVSVLGADVLSVFDSDDDSLLLSLFASDLLSEGALDEDLPFFLA